MCADAHRLQKGVHEADVHHAHLIDDHAVRLQRHLLVPFEVHAAPVTAAFLLIRRRSCDLQQTVDRLRLTSRGLRHPLRSSACGRRQQDLRPLALEIADDGVDRRGLSCPRASGDDKKSRPGSFNDCLALQFIELDAVRLFHRAQHGKDPFLRLVRADIQVVQHGCHIQFHIVEGGRVYRVILLFLRPGSIARDKDPAVRTFHDDLPVHLEVGKHLPHPLRFDPQQFRGPSQKDALRQIHVALGRRLGQAVKDPAPDAVLRVPEDPRFGGDLVRDPESDPRHIIRKLVGILPDDGIDPVAVLLPDADAEIHADPEFREKQHGLAHLPLLLDLGADLHGHPFTDAFDLREALRLFLQDAQRVRLEPLHDPRRQCLADPLNSAGGQPALYALTVLRFSDLI